MEKVTSRVLMYVTPDMQREVEALAHFEGRPVNHQYRRLIMLGLEQVRRSGGHGIHESTPELSSTFQNQPIFAKEEAKESSGTSRNLARPIPPIRVATAHRKRGAA